MKNLLKEINDNKLLSNSKISEDFKRGFNRGLDLSQEIINQYNIITAPKTIELSEIVSKLKEIYVEEVVVKDNGFCGYVISRKLFTGEDSDEFYMNDFIVEIDDGEIFEIYAPLEDNTKWLYTLWIAGTEIVDDLAGDE